MSRSRSRNARASSADACASILISGSDGAAVIGPPILWGPSGPPPVATVLGDSRPGVRAGPWLCERREDPSNLGDRGSIRGRRGEAAHDDRHGRRQKPPVLLERRRHMRSGRTLAKGGTACGGLIQQGPETEGVD